MNLNYNNMHLSYNMNLNNSTNLNNNMKLNNNMNNIYLNNKQLMKFKNE